MLKQKIEHQLTLAIEPKTIQQNKKLLSAAYSESPKKQAKKPKDKNRNRKDELWLCLYFPKISLELISNKKQEIAQVTVEEMSGTTLVHTFNQIADEYGITAQMSLNAAYALCPELCVYQRDKNKEITYIESLANWLQKFTSHVHIVSENKVLLDIKANLAYFSGLTPLIMQLEQGFSEKWAYLYQIAVTTTPLSSQLLSELSTENNKIIIEDKDNLRQILGRLSVYHLLKDEQKLLTKLNKTGIETIQDLWRLPRDGLARRFGPELLKKMDKLAGNVSDLRLKHQAPLRFSAFTELPMETSNQKIMMQGALHLFKQLIVFLRQHDAGIVKLQFRLKHLRNFTDIFLNFRQITRNLSHLSSLLTEKMERTRLTSSVIEMTLIVDEVLSFVGVNPMLFNDINIADSSYGVDLEWENTLEQLQNRLGAYAVKYFQVIDDIHPDYAWRYSSHILVAQDMGVSMRPLCLLLRIKPLKRVNNLPSYLGVLSLRQGPERIETGWWREDDQKISRDYYIAFNDQAGHLWVYRDLRKNGEWYLHGFFG